MGKGCKHNYENAKCKRAKGKDRKDKGGGGKGKGSGGGKGKGSRVGKPTGGRPVGLLREWQQPSQWRGGWDNYKGGPARNDLVF